LLPTDRHTERTTAELGLYGTSRHFASWLYIIVT